MDKKANESVPGRPRGSISLVNVFRDPHTINFTVAYLCGLGLTIDSIVTSAFPTGTNAKLVFSVGVISAAAGVISWKFAKKPTTPEVLMITSDVAKIALNSGQSSESQERAVEPRRDPNRVHSR